MIRLLAVGIWVLLVALGSSWAVASMKSEAKKETEPTYFEGLDYRSTDSITIPMIAKQKIQGYILARFVYTIDGKTVVEMKVPPDPFILDEAFRRIYTTEGFEFDKPEQYDLTALTGGIRDAVNGKYGKKVIEDVLVQQFDYIAKEDARTGNASPASALQRDGS